MDDESAMEEEEIEENVDDCGDDNDDTDEVFNTITIRTMVLIMFT